MLRRLSKHPELSGLKLHGCSPEISRHVFILQVSCTLNQTTTGCSTHFIARYYSGEKVAPILTIFIGGNHEASNFLQELAYGGWVAPNIYYLGYAGVIVVNGIRIAGISGIYNYCNFEKGHFEFPPYDHWSMRSVYGIRSMEVFRLSQLTNRIDIMLSHDWPNPIWDYGNKEQLLRFKPYFRVDMQNGKMGSGPCFYLLTTLRPHNWYAAHMHCRFDANVPHDNNESTRFVALDKCLPNKKFLDFLTIGDDEEDTQSTDVQTLPLIEYDLEWLTVLYLTNNLLNVSKNYTKLPLQPGPGDPQDNVQRYEFTPTKEEMDAVLKKFNGDLKIPNNFTQTVQAYDPQRDGRNFKNLNERVHVELNPQTTEFCAKLGIDDPLFLAAKFAKIDLTTSTVNLLKTFNDNKESDVLVPTISRAPLASFLPQPKFGNDEEINLDELDEEETPTERHESTEVKADEGSLNQQDQPEDLSMKTASTSINELSAASESAEAKETFASPPSKKFKRRNQEIYKTKNDV